MIDVIIDEAKIRNYLLNLNHPDGRAKARFFIAGGFSLDDIGTLDAALRRHYAENSATARFEIDRFGLRRVIIDAPMQAPDGRTPKVRTIWRLVEESHPPSIRLITAYPTD